MGSLAPVYHWPPQDDLSLKQGIEEGASLEALARGAKRFSRRYTVQELTDRWYSLLYDPVVSEEASVNMFELYRYNSATQSKSPKEAKHTAAKRKAESVRRHYHSMRKRICNDPFDLLDLDFLDGTGYCDTGNINEPSSTDYGISVSAFQGGLYDFDPTHPSSHVAMPGDQDGLNDCAPYNGTLGLDVKRSPTFCQSNEHDINASSAFDCEAFNSSASACGTSQPNFGRSLVSEPPCWNTVEGFTDSTLSDALGHGEQSEMKDLGDPSNVNEMAMQEDRTMCSLSSTLNGHMSCDYMEGSAVNAEDYLMELSNTLLNSTEDELLFTDADGSDLIDKTYMENLSSLLFNIPDESDMSNVGLSETPFPLPLDSINTSSGEHDGESCAKELDICVDHHIIGSSETQKLSSVLKVNPAFPEMRNGVICCILNTEDPEIPNNDDVFLPFRIPSMSTEFDTACYPLASSANMLSVSSKDSYTNYFEHPSSLAVPIKPQLGLGVKREHSKTEGPSLTGLTRCTTSRVASGPVKESTAINELPRILNHNSHDSHFRFHKNGSSSNWESSTFSVQKSEALHTEQQCNETNVPDLFTDALLSDEEEFSCDSDGDVPYCSDVEAMILDMDLIPDDQELYSSQEVLKYRNEDAKRVIMRLEQASESCIQRSMVAHKAFAVLYGRHSKHFIRKTEVLLGRGTEDVKVDIDLGKEVRANMLSRRQATIKMDACGSFHLKNHSKQSIYVNGSEVGCGTDVILASGSLLEIRELSFIFEINKANAKFHRHNFAGDTATENFETTSRC